MTNGLIAIDQDCAITAFNPAAATMLGCTEGKILNQPMADLFPGAERLIEIFQVQG